MLPMLAAVGECCCSCPLIYLALNASTAPHGWATPIATDIASALGVMSLLGRIGPQTKVFFQTLLLLTISWCGHCTFLWPHARYCLVRFSWSTCHFVRNESSEDLLFWSVFACWFWCSGSVCITQVRYGRHLAFSLPSHSDVRLSKLQSGFQTCS